MNVQRHKVALVTSSKAVAKESVWSLGPEDKGILDGQTVVCLGMFALFLDTVMPLKKPSLALNPSLASTTQGLQLALHRMNQRSWNCRRLLARTQQNHRVEAWNSNVAAFQNQPRCFLFLLLTSPFYYRQSRNFSREAVVPVYDCQSGIMSSRQDFPLCLENYSPCDREFRPILDLNWDFLSFLFP